MTSDHSADLARMIADLEAKQKALGEAIDRLRFVMNPAAANGAPSDSPGSGASRTELPVGAFLNKSIPAAVVLYLSSVRQKQSVRQVAAALKEGGLESKAKKFEGAVNTALNRLKDSGKVLRFPDGWALASHYPAHIRASAHPNHKATRTEPAGQAESTEQPRGESSEQQQDDPAAV